MPSPDVAVVGLGPAGRALTHRLLARGASVLAVDPHPHRRWPQTFGGWERQLPAWLPASVRATSSPAVDLVARGRHRLPDTYVVLDNDALQGQLDVAGAEISALEVGEGELEPLAPIVVDCRGNSRLLANPHVPAQTAYGVALPREAVAGWLGDADAILMDWRTPDGSSSWAGRRPSFCYLVPLTGQLILVEETSLAARPALSLTELAARLGARLSRHGVALADHCGAPVERVRIPMLPGGSPLRHRFGAAGEQLNPMTGYSVFASLRDADGAAAALLGDGAALAGAPAVRRVAQRALLQLSGDATVDLFDGFARLAARQQRAILDGEGAGLRLVAALARQWALMPPGARLALVAATAAGVTR